MRVIKEPEIISELYIKKIRDRVLGEIGSEARIDQEGESDTQVIKYEC